MLKRRVAMRHEGCGTTRWRSACHWVAAAGCAASCLLCGSAVAAEEEAIERLKSLSIEDLANTEVSIVSKRPERLGDTPAAVFVITSEDLRRSGVTHIAEALRMVPGLNVARLDASQWAVSARGFNGRFANKLLVLIDGRSVYTPLFSGVFWDAQDTFLADVERIEVIRGPGASTWGANAVNGVINIITKSAHATTGGRVDAYGGNQDRGGGVRFGGRAGHSGAYRIYAKTHERDPMPPGHESAGEWNGGRSGFRTDWNPEGTNRFTFQGDVYREDSTDFRSDGFNLLGLWEHDHDDGSTSSVQAYFDRTDFDGRGNILDEILETYDIEFQQNRVPVGRHRVVFGAGYRRTRSDITPVPPNGITEPVRTDDLLSAFVQDDIRLAGERWYLTAGTKLEDNDYTGFEVQPTLRLRWLARPAVTLWASVSRAVRAPSRAEDDLVLETQIAPPSPMTMGLPVVLRTTGDRRFKSETLVAYEAGLRWHGSTRWALDAAFFFNDYDDLRTVEIDPSPPMPVLEPFPRLVSLAHADNLLVGQARGAEVLVDWHPASWVRVQGAYSLLDIELDPSPRSTDPIAHQGEGESPEHQLSLRSLFDLGRHLDLDVWGRYVDELPTLGIDSYATFDLRLGWHATPALDLSLVGRNLAGDRHREFGAFIFTEGTGQLVEREVLLRLNWSF